MAKESKFKTGMKVKSILNNFSEYEIVEVLRNRLVVKPTDEANKNLSYTCEKNIFEVIEE